MRFLLASLPGVVLLLVVVGEVIAVFVIIDGAEVFTAGRVVDIHVNIDHVGDGHIALAFVGTRTSLGSRYAILVKVIIKTVYCLSYCRIKTSNCLLLKMFNSHPEDIMSTFCRIFILYLL